MRSSDDVRALVPPALLDWIDRDDPLEAPPALDARYDTGLQRTLIYNEERLRTHGIWDGTRRT